MSSKSPKPFQSQDPEEIIEELMKLLTPIRDYKEEKKKEAIQEIDNKFNESLLEALQVFGDEIRSKVMEKMVQPGLNPQ